MKNSLENITFNLYNEIKRFQGNVDESLAITLALIYTIFIKKEEFIRNVEAKTDDPVKNWNNGIDWIGDDLTNYMDAHFISDKTDEYIINNIRKYIIYSKAPKRDIYLAIDKLIEEKNLLLEPSMRRTPKEIQKIITTIASSMNVKGPCIDLAIGTGSLLRDLKGELWGDDINPKMVIIARCYLFFANEDILFDGLKNDIRLNDCINTYDYRKYKNAVVIFDPPMGDLRQIPDKWIQNEKLAEIIKPKKKNLKLPSEVLFLLNFLINSNKNDYFIGLFPESIINRNNNEYNNLRQYILRNSLLAVIKVQTGHVLLVGINSTNLRTKYPRIPILNIKGHLNSEQIEYIANHITNKNYEYEEFYDIEPIDRGTIIQQIGLREYNKMYAQIFAYKVYARDELLITNSIPIPTISSYEEKISKNPKELLKSIQEKENNIKNAITYIENIISELPEDEEVPEEKQWFEDGTTEEEKALKYFWDIRTEKYFESEPFISQYKYKNKMDKECLSNLKILKKCKRLTFTKASYINIHFGEKDNKNKLKDEVFYTKLKPINFDKNIKLLLNMADETVKNIYDNHCRYTIGDLPEEETYLNNKEYGFKDLVRAFVVLEKLGLVIRNYIDETESKSEMSLYNEYSTYIPTVDKEEEKRYVY